MAGLLAVYQHGSTVTGAADPGDLDVLVVTTEDLDRAAALELVAPLLDNPGRLPVDITVAHPGRFSVMERAIVTHGQLLTGEDISGIPPRPVEWAGHLALAAAQMADSRPAAAGLAAVQAILAGAGHVVPTKSAIPAAAEGTTWEPLAAAAWAARRHAGFTHPDLGAALHEAAWAAAGEAATPEYEQHGWSSRTNRAAVLTVYRQTLAAHELAQLAALPTTTAMPGGRTKRRIDDPALTECFAAIITAAAGFWWPHQEIAGFEPLELHRYRSGDVFPAHVDRLPMYPNRALNVVAMIQPATTGGRLHLDLGGEPITPSLAPGDVIVFDSTALHGVSPVEAGERIVVVSHVHALRPQ